MGSFSVNKPPLTCYVTSPSLEFLDRYSTAEPCSSHKGTFNVLYLQPDLPNWQAVQLE